jgi:CHASE3 domain sensor protein
LCFRAERYAVEVRVEKVAYDSFGAERRGATTRVPHSRNWVLIGMVFVVVMLLALIILPPLISARDDRVRAQLGDAQAFADALTVTENDLQQMQSNVRGYLITRTPIFVEQYKATQDSLPANL